MPRLSTWRDLTDESADVVYPAIHRPVVELAENVARFETPFEYLKTALGGFDDMGRFLLNKTLLGDADAIAAREDVIRVIRNHRLDEPLLGEIDLDREYFNAHRDEYETYRRRHYPWVYSRESSGPARDDPDPETDSLLDHYICTGLGEYGFGIRTRKFKKNYWRCHSSLLSRRMTIYFDKGTYLPSVSMSGYMRIEDLGYEVSLGDPFFFSGAEFRTSVVDQLPVQYERFFREYIRIFPHVVKALETGIAAADDVLVTLSKKSVS